MALASSTLREITTLVGGIPVGVAQASGTGQTTVVLNRINKPVRSVSGYQREGEFHIEVSKRGDRDDYGLWDEVERVTGLLETVAGYQPGSMVMDLVAREKAETVVALDFVVLLGGS